MLYCIREKTLRRGWLRVRSGGGLVVLFVDRDGFEVFGLEYLVTIQAADIIHPVAPRQNLGSTVIAGLHNGD